MTPDEHEILALKMRGLAQQTLLDWLAKILGALYGSPQSELRSALLLEVEQALTRIKADYADMTLAHLHPVESDLHAALFQESFDDLSKRLMGIISNPAMATGKPGAES